MTPCVFCILCCAFVRCALSVVDVQCVCVGVCVGVGVGVGVCWCVLVLVCHADPLPPLLSPCVCSRRPRVCQHHAHMKKHMWAWCRYTRGRFSNVSHHTPHRTHTTTHNNTPQQHNNTRRQSQREEKRKSKRREDQEKRGEEKIKRRSREIRCVVRVVVWF